MRLNKTEREEFRRRVKNVDSSNEKNRNCKSLKILSYHRKTIYYTINRMRFSGKINDKMKTGRLTSWTSVRKI